ncbi:MAG: hypothetical protein WCK89_18905 [bacterium]
MNVFGLVKLLAVTAGIVCAIVDPARLMADYYGVYHHLFRRFCWIVGGMGFSQFVAHCGMARVYYYGIYKPGVSAEVIARLSRTKNRLAGQQLLCALLMVGAMLLTLSAALDWVPVRRLVTASSFAEFSRTNKGLFILIHILVVASVPLAGMKCNSITNSGIGEANAADD